MTAAWCITIAGRTPTNSPHPLFHPEYGNGGFSWDFASRPNAASTTDTSTFFDLGGAGIAFVNSGGAGQVQVYNATARAAAAGSQSPAPIQSTPKARP